MCAHTMLAEPTGGWMSGLLGHLIALPSYQARVSLPLEKRSVPHVSILLPLQKKGPGRPQLKRKKKKQRKN